VRWRPAMTAARADDALRAQPWSSRALRVVPHSTTDSAPELLLAALGDAPDTAAAWARALAALPSAAPPVVEPVRDVVRRPIAVVLAQAALGQRFGPELGRVEIERRIHEQFRSMGAGVAVKTNRPEGGSDLLLVPTRPGTRATVGIDTASADTVTLLVIRRRVRGGADSIWLPVGASSYAHASAAERVRLIRDALRARGVDRVRVSLSGGEIRIDFDARRDAGERSPR